MSLTGEAIYIYGKEEGEIPKIAKNPALPYFMTSLENFSNGVEGFTHVDLKLLRQVNGFPELSKAFIENQVESGHVSVFNHTNADGTAKLDIVVVTRNKQVGEQMEKQPWMHEWKKSMSGAMGIYVTTIDGTTLGTLGTTENE